VVDGLACELAGVHTFDAVRIINGGVITVDPFDGIDRINSGNLELRADTIFVDATSSIVARGSGYQTVRCGDGGAPAASPLSGGQGGCSVRDSGGGGAHFGAGGRGTKDCFVVDPADSCQFPDEFSEDCGNTLAGDGSSCTDRSDCRDFDGLVSVAGVPFTHSIYEVEFGAAGGDKGCRDGDGFGTQPNVAGPGGGRIVLAAVTGAGTVTIDGTIDANGRRGCGTGNDSAGGGAGGSIVIAGLTVQTGDGARVSAAGGLGGDTQGLAGDPTGECGAPAQQGGTCDDCGGGGGGGIIAVLSVVSDLSFTSTFDVNGAVGGTCTICQGEAGGGAGELQVDGGYVGEFCDGFDNDFDGEIDEGLPLLACGLPSCVGGIPQTCPPDVPGCIDPVTDTRARFAVVLDTSGSMLTDVSGAPTFGDGSVGHVGADMNGDGIAGNDSKLFQAKEALSTVIAAYPEIDFALGRYYQDQSVDRSCQLAHWFECAGICCSYDDPIDNTAPAATPACTLDRGASGPIAVNMVSTAGDECINYAGSCGPPRRGADFLVGFGADVNQLLSWLDHDETNFINDTTPGDFCDFASGGDCELRGTGPTPLAGSLQAAQAFLEPIVACDAANACRSYGVILLTDGAESCEGDPVTAAADLFAAGVETFVVGFSVLASETAELNAIAQAGSGGTRNAFLVGDEDELANALAEIVGGSIVFEECNGLDDDCDSAIDEDFPDLGDPCDDGESGVCLGTGEIECTAAGDGTECVITDPGEAPQAEVCDGIDNNCNGLIDEGLSCIPDCTPTGEEVCDGIDNNCNGAIDEDDPAIGTECGTTDVGQCEFGVNACIGGEIVCVGAVEPADEICNGLDDDCDGVGDNMAMCPAETSCVEGACRIPCSGGEFACPVGFTCVDTEDGQFCVPDPCVNCQPNESCIDDVCVDLCDGVTCDSNEVCRRGECLDCTVIGCPQGQVCFDRQCVADPCDTVDCNDGQSCVNGECRDNCDDDGCPAGQLCNLEGDCVDDPCGDVTCRSNEVCADGICTADPCEPVRCSLGEVCVAGECVNDPCTRVQCSAGRSCVALPDGEARCQSDAEVEPSFQVAAGGGGCATARSPTASAPPWLLLALFLWRRRRTSGGAR